MVAPLAIFLCLVISMGALLQTHLLESINSDAPSVYEAIYQDNIVKFPPISSWLAAGLTPLFLLLSAIIADLSLRGRRLWNVVALSVVCTASVLTIADLIFFVTQGRLEANIVVFNAVSNLAGSLVVAFLIGLILPVYPWLRRAFPDAGSAVHYVAAACVICAGFGISATTYFGIIYLYEPVEVRFRAVVEPPVEGSIIPGQDSAGDFDFLPRSETKAMASLTSPGGHPKISWQSATSIVRYDISLHVLANCYGKDLNKVVLGPAVLSRSAISALEASFDEGHALFQIQGTPGSAFAFSQKNPRSYWVKNEDKGFNSVSYFVAEDGILVASSSGEIRLLAGAILMRTIGKSSGGIASRELALMFGGERIALSLQYEKSARGGTCTPISRPRIAAVQPGARLPRALTLSVPSAQVSAVMKITPHQSDSDFFDLSGSKLSIRNANGWLEVSNIPDRDFARGRVGTLPVVSFEGKPAAIEVDGRKVEATPFDTFVAVGTVEGAVIRGSHIRFNGKAASLWKGDSRLNPTRWERLPTEFRFTLLGALLVFMWGLVRSVWWPGIKNWGETDVRDWVSLDQAGSSSP